MTSLRFRSLAISASANVNVNAGVEGAAPPRPRARVRAARVHPGWGVCGSGVPPYDFLNLYFRKYGVFDSRFCLAPQLLSLRLPLKAL